MESVMMGSAEGTLSHVPPELLERKQHSYSGDIYSLSILLYELWYGREAYSGKEHAGISVYQLLEAIKTGERPKFKEKTAPVEDLKTLLMKCWSETPAARPTAPDVKENLQCLYRKLYNSNVTENRKRTMGLVFKDN